MALNLSYIIEGQQSYSISVSPKPWIYISPCFIMLIITYIALIQLILIPNISGSGLLCVILEITVKHYKLLDIYEVVELNSSSYG